MDFEPGDTVIIKEESLSTLYSSQFKGLEHRTVEVLGGFGTKSFLSGTAVFVRFPDGEQARVDRYDIDMEATKVHWAEHGRSTK